jgi:hypothetical protein
MHLSDKVVGQLAIIVATNPKTCLAYKMMSGSSPAAAFRFIRIVG